MEPEAFLNLFDSCWFYTEEVSISSTEEPLRVLQGREEPCSPTSTSHDQIMNLSSSNDLLAPSIDSVFLKPQLETILSRKELSRETVKIPDFKKQRQWPRETRRSGPSKSLSELEFEELKGFMDLGFVFSEEDKKNSELVDIIPGLHRLGQSNKSGEGEEEAASPDDEEACEPRTRPYLSEAWEMLEKDPLMNWRVPSIGNEDVMKDSLKWWAHRVASAAL